jgi:hypothetical protein
MAKVLNDDGHGIFIDHFSGLRQSPIQILNSDNYKVMHLRARGEESLFLLFWCLK